MERGGGRDDGGGGGGGVGKGESGGRNKGSDGGDWKKEKEEEGDIHVGKHGEDVSISDLGNFQTDGTIVS